MPSVILCYICRVKAQTQTSQFGRIAHREILIRVVLKIALFQEMQLEII